MKYLIYLVVILFFGSCSFGLQEDLEFQKAESLIKHYETNQNIDSLLLEESNALQFISNNELYLFVVNGFNSDFNGYIYSNSQAPIPKEIKFNNFHIHSMDSTKGKWTKVYGKW